MKIKEIGERCKRFRIMKSYLQSQVAQEVGCSRENVAAFDNGRNDSAIIFLWYIKKGLNINED